MNNIEKAIAAYLAMSESDRQAFAAIVKHMTGATATIEAKQSTRKLSSEERSRKMYTDEEREMIKDAFIADSTKHGRILSGTKKNLAELLGRTEKAINLLATFYETGHEKWEKFLQA